MCDEAETLLHAAGLSKSFEKIEIDDNPELLERYEIYIPVLKRMDNQQELFWPFDQQQLSTFVEADK